MPSSSNPGHQWPPLAQEITEMPHTLEIRNGQASLMYVGEPPWHGLGLLFLAVRPMAKVERMDVIAQGIRSMTSEEAYYWYAKCTGSPAAERAQQALRVLLADE
jgi:hypothetical protein